MALLQRSRLLARYLNSGLNSPSLRHINVYVPDKETKLKDLPKRLVKCTVEFPYEVKKFFKEQAEDYAKYKRVQGVELLHNDYEVLYTFNSEEDIQNWIVTSDSDNKDGTSACDFRLSPHKTGLYTGYLSTRVMENVPALHHTGYTNISAEPKLKSFWRIRHMDLSNYTHFLIRCRGDGRNYMFNVHMDRFFDVQWHDMYSYPLYTRGGPYWQLEKIPISKLVFANDGRLQDDQEDISLDCIKCLSFTTNDALNGPFSLEIDFIAAVLDKNHKEKSHYERYNVPLSHFY